jgi:Family of unknown function (DUF6114)
LRYDQIMSANEKPTVSFILSIVGGIFILLGGALRFFLGSLGYGWMRNGYWGYGGYGGMMGGYWSGPGFGLMGGYGFGFFSLFGVLGLVFGAIVIVSALMLYNHTTDHSKWGILILIFSILSIFGGAMSGFGVGLILGVLGGVFAITWKPPATPAK